MFVVWNVLSIPKAEDTGGATCAMPLNAERVSYMWEVSNPKSEQWWAPISSVRQNPLWKVAAGRKPDNMQRWNAFHLCFWTGCFSPSLIFFFFFFSPPEKQHWQPHSYCGYEENTKSRSDLAGLMPLLSWVVVHRAELFIKKNCGCHFLLCPSIQQWKQFSRVAAVFVIQLWEQ